MSRASGHVGLRQSRFVEVWIETGVAFYFVRHQGVPVLDLDYREDSTCETDMNVVMTGSSGLVEVQGTAEGEPFTREQLDAMVDLAARCIAELVAALKRLVGLAG